MRLLDRLQQFDISTQYTAGHISKLTDFLSELSTENSPTEGKKSRKNELINLLRSILRKL